MKTDMKGIVIKSITKVKRNAPAILTVASAVGLVTTVVLAVKETPKALQLLEKAEEELGESLSVADAIIIAGPVYIPATLVGIATLSCIIGNGIVNSRRQKALSSAYLLLNSRFKEYQKMVDEVYGVGADKRVRDKICEHHYMSDKLVSEDETSTEIDVVPTNDGKILFFDEYSNRFFRATKEDIYAAEYHINRYYITHGEVTLNEFYESIGIDPIISGGELGWCYEFEEDNGYQWIDFNHRLVRKESGEEYCYVITTPFGPYPMPL